jgi:hypothetical protein
MAKDDIKKIIEITIKNAMKELKNELLTEIKEVKDSMNFMNSMFEDLKTRLEENENKIKKIEDEMISNKKMMENDIMKPLTKIQASICELEIQHTLNHLEIVGIPFNNNENLNNIIENISKQLNIPENAKNNIIAKRQNRQPEKNNIIIKLHSKENEEIWINNIKKNKNITHSSTNNKIFINQQLTKNLKTLHWQIKQLRKTLSIEYVWIKEHRLFARIKTGTPAISITSAEQIANIIDSINKDN